ncbi:glutathione reductase [Xylocopilactobacillus apicola]|uniref:Glutathione reductase n=2 Tax=Xylocopilactobacillus apicola TaxID=2932184 RepID=A0AAU9CXR3_9LACO|nr:glutathione reductase [Xylocopilactobacillus apicola]
MQKVDTLIIGSGPGALAAAYKLATEQSVLVCEDDLWGGTCPNRGCDPKKMLYAGAEIYAQAQRFQNSGLKGNLEVDWPALMAFKETYTKNVPSQTKSGLETNQIETVQGTAQFQAANQVKINEELYEAKNIIIATGQRPRSLQIPGAKYAYTSNEFLSLAKMPKHVTVIGAGYIALELSNLARCAGAEVDVIQHNDHPLKAFPAELASDLVKNMQQTGVNFYFNEEIQAIRKVGASFEVATNTQTIQTNWILNATGRVPNVEKLNLEAAGIKSSPAGIEVNDHLETSCASVYAIGDCLAKKLPKLTPVAEFEGNYVASNILAPKPPIRYPSIPTVVFSSLKLAQVGFESLDPQNAYETKITDVTNWYNYRRVQEPGAKVMTVIDRSTGNLVAGAILSSSADDLINQFALLINHKISAEDVAKTIFAYPSISADLNYLY